MLGQLLNRPTTNPSKMLDKLSHLREKEGRLIKELEAVQNEIASYQAALSEFVNPTPAVPHTPQRAGLLHSTQTTTYPTQVVSGVHTRNTQPTAMAPTATVHPTNVTAAASIVDKLAPQARTKETPVVPTAPQTRLRASVQAAAPSSNTVPGVIDILANRAPYHTADVQITGINEYGQVLMHEHYLAGDNTTGIPTPEGYDVRLVTSKAGKTYRLMSVPALKITCSLTKPLPEDLVSRKRMLREWLAANDYLKGTDPSKAQFYTEYDAWGEEYTPYASVDGKGTTLYIYIGCESLSSAKPCPTLIA